MVCHTWHLYEHRQGPKTDLASCLDNLIDRPLQLSRKNQTERFGGAQLALCGQGHVSGFAFQVSRFHVSRCAPEATRHATRGDQDQLTGTAISLAGTSNVSHGTSSATPETRNVKPETSPGTHIALCGLGFIRGGPNVKNREIESGLEPTSEGKQGVEAVRLKQCTRVPCEEVDLEGVTLPRAFLAGWFSGGQNEKDRGDH
jgi:hypothetical protein